jgi:hypothetical protein
MLQTNVAGTSYFLLEICFIWGCIQKFPDWVDNEIYANNNKNSLRSNTKGYGGKTHYADSQNIDTSAPSGIELYHLQFSLQEASPGTFGYTHVSWLLHFKPEIPPFSKPGVCNYVFTR